MKFFDEPWLEIIKLNVNEIVATSGFGENVAGDEDETELPSN